MKAGKLVKEAVATLEASPAIDHWQKNRELYEAVDLLAFVLGGAFSDDDRVGERKAERFRRVIERRATGEPVALIKGETEFRGLDLGVQRGVFVPRDSSEWLAEKAVRRLRGRKGPVHVDLATGAGTIALAVANEVPEARVLGTDVSREAVALARRNARRLGLRARFEVGDLFEPVPKSWRGSVDVITVHPPYVARDEVADLPDEIRRWEPAHTLTDRSDDGLGIVRRVADDAPRWLRPKGWLLMEADPDRARDVRTVLVRAGYRDVKSTKGGDLKVTRVVVARRPG